MVRKDQSSGIHTVSLGVLFSFVIVLAMSTPADDSSNAAEDVSSAAGGGRPHTDFERQLAEADTPATLGRYRIVRRLGVGGMAEVFLAKYRGAEGIEKTLVLKRILPAFSKNPRFVAMFVAEAKVAMRLNHPNIVQIYAFEQVQREFLLAMEFVDGFDLKRLINFSKKKKRALGPTLSAYVVSQAARGVAYAHTRSDESGDSLEIVHRDLSPQNILISRDGIVKITDFGIAKAANQAEESGVVKGKFAYMSPEQARGGEVDQRSDIYGLGMVLAELLVGDKALADHDGSEGRKAINLWDIDRKIPKVLKEIVTIATAADPHDRFETARELVRELEDYIRNEPERADAEALDAYISEIGPSEDPLDGQQSNSGLDHTVANQHELRERRRVVVVAGRIALGDGSSAHLSKRDRHTISDLAFREDAVVDFHSDGSRFTATIGLGRVEVHDPLRSLRLTLDLTEALNANWVDEARANRRDNTRTPLLLSVGISRGLETTVRDVSGRLISHQPVGGFWDEAHSLCSRAQPGETLVTREVYELTEHEFVFHSVFGSVDGELSKEVWRFDRPKRVREKRRSEHTLGTSQFIGRNEEAARLRDIWRESYRHGRTSFVAIVGELGIGKSAFVDAALPTLDGQPKIVRTDAHFAATDAAYGVLRDALTALVGRLAFTDQSGAALEIALATFCQTRNEVVEIKQGLSSLIPGASFLSINQRVSRHTLRRSVLRLIANWVKKNGPLVFCIDALQWCDAGTLEVLRAIQQAAYDVPVAVILVARPATRLDAVFSGVPRISLSELNVAEIERFILNKTRANAVPEEITLSVASSCGGNPLFLTEFLDELLKQRALRVVDGSVVRREDAAVSVPATLEDALAARIGGLADDERISLHWLAIAGNGLTLEDGSVLSRAFSEQSVSSLAREKLVIKRDDGYALSNAIVRSAVLRLIDGPERLRMHRRVATLLSERGASPENVAYHLKRSGDASRAALMYCQAASAAEAIFAPREAYKFLKRAEKLLPESDPQRFEIQVRQEKIMRAIGHKELQRQALRALEQTAQLTGLPAHGAYAALRRVRHALDRGSTSKAAIELELGLALAQEAQERGLELDALRLKAKLRRQQGATEEAVRICDDALKLAKPLETYGYEQGSLLLQKGIALRILTQPEQAIACYLPAIIIFRQLGDKSQQAFALNACGVALATLGRFEEAIGLIRASVTLDRETGNRYRLGRKLSNIGQLYIALGDTATGRSFLLRALDVFEVAEDIEGHIDTLIALTDLALAHNNLSSAQHYLRLIESSGRHRVERYDAVAVDIYASRVALLERDLSSAERLITEAIREAQVHNFTTLLALARSTRARIALERGATKEAGVEVSDALSGLRNSNLVRIDKEYAFLHKTADMAHNQELMNAIFDAGLDTVESRLLRIQSGELRRMYTNTPHAQAFLRTAT